MRRNSDRAIVALAAIVGALTGALTAVIRH